MKTSSPDETIRHTRKMKEQMGNLVGQLRAGVTQVTDPRAKAMFEASAEVITGLVMTFDHYERKSEAAWKDSES